MKHHATPVEHLLAPVLSVHASQERVYGASETMLILGIETSCDETGAAIIQDGKYILTNVVASSAEMHIKYGGIVPEVAARKQVEMMIPVLQEAMEGFSKNDIDAIAVTVGPGLIGSLLVGVETAKTLAAAWNKPIIPVNHVLAHAYAVFLDSDTRYAIRDKQKNNPPDTNYELIKFPAISLVVSGGHTELYLMNDEKHMRWLGGTLDDAAGECFDKCARLLGLPYPGGPPISEHAKNFKLSTLNFKLGLPRPMMHDDSLNFSFSGLKTAVFREWKKHVLDSQFADRRSQFLSLFAYEIQESITDVLVKKTIAAAEKYGAKSIIVGGGVAANERLTEKLKVSSKGRPAFGWEGSKLKIYVPEPHLCVDSASFIASYAYYHNHPVDWQSINANPGLEVETA